MAYHCILAADGTVLIECEVVSFDEEAIIVVIEDDDVLPPSRQVCRRDDLLVLHYGS